MIEFWVRCLIINKFYLFFFITDTCTCTLGPSIKELVTDGNTKLFCRGFILALFQSTTANKIDSEHTQDYKRLLSVCEAEILQITVNRIKVFLSFYVDFWGFLSKSAENS